ncbi:Nuclear pore complex protein Nup50 [Cichlidogyrus casuarinus]|uniref:Nuclear pore complex protein Nup50 n=1 Tax=Cichlidogyrus casuarinus TaxID=1844966 RepID=A0ABD2Q953_9PLAT
MPKRNADTELNADNYDQEFEKVERGSFQRADTMCLKDRVILSVKRVHHASNDVNTHGVLKNFSGFAGSSSTPKSTGLFQFNAKKDQNPVVKESTNKTLDSESGNKDYPPEFLNQLTALNKSLVNWIEKHVKDDPVCILSPIFVDYNNHFEDLKKKHQIHTENGTGKNSTFKQTNNISDASKQAMSNFKFGLNNSNNITTAQTTASETLPKESDTQKPLFSFTNSATADRPTAKFVFGSASTGSAEPAKTLFKFGAEASSDTSKPLFSFGSNNTASTSQTATGTFSFGSKSPAFLSNQPIAQTDDVANDDEEYVPPEAEKSTRKEEGSVYDVRCKLFARIADSWKDKGIGNAFIKPIESESKKFQLIIRADTTLSKPV